MRTKTKSRFTKIVAKHETTYDPSTGREWQTYPFAKPMTWAEAETVCRELRLGGYSDWRLPTRAELLTLVDVTRHNPAIDTDAFPNTPPLWFWAATPYAPKPALYAWVVNFYDGHSGYDSRDSRLRVRAVRAARRQARGLAPAHELSGGSATPAYYIP